MANKVNCKKYPNHPSCKKTTTTSGTPTTPKKDPFKEYPKLNQNIQKLLEIDSDGDGIPDALEKNGYTISEVFDQEHGYFNVMPWSETYDHNPDFYNHHPKYISNPFDKNTVGDPYTDLEKAGRSIYIEGSILQEAYHPLVAACPSVATFMEGFILKDVQDKENTSTTGHTYHTSYGFEDTRTIGNGIDLANAGKLEFGGKGVKNGRSGEHGGETPNISGSVRLSRNLKHHTNEQQGVTTVSSLQEANQQTSESLTTIHSASAAILQGIVRYQNMGTAKISNMRPTLNFQVEDQPLFTYKVPDGAEKLSPGDSYPSLDTTGTIVTPGDSFQGHPSTIDTGAKKKLAEGKPLKVVTTQIDGTFKATAGSGKYAPGTEVEWSQVTDTMMQRTARLLLETPNETLDRRVAAPSADEVVGIPDKTKPESGIPQITVEQAIQFAFGAKKDNRGNLVMTTQQGLTYKIDRSHVALHVNQKTDALIAKQLQAFKDKGDDTKSIYDVTLTKEMVILIKPILEVNAFLNNDYLYIENQFDQSLSYSVWKNTGTGSKLLKQGIVPSHSTIGTGYYCANPAEEISILVSGRVSQVIFKGGLSSLKGFEKNVLQPTGDALHIQNTKYQFPIKWDWHLPLFDKIQEIYTQYTPRNREAKNRLVTDGEYFSEQIQVLIEKEQIKLRLKSVGPDYSVNTDYFQIKLTSFDVEMKVNGVTHTQKYKVTQWPNPLYGIPEYNIRVPFKSGVKNSVHIKFSLCGKYFMTEHSSFEKKKQIDGLAKETPNNDNIKLCAVNVAKLLQKQTSVDDVPLYSGAVDFNVIIPKSYESQKILPIQYNITNNTQPVSLYQQAETIYMFNKSLQPVSFCILNQYQESVKQGILESSKSISIGFKELLSWKNGVYKGNLKELSDRIIITINQMPIFDGNPKEAPSKEQIQNDFKEVIKGYEIDYWHMNNNTTNPAYDSVCFKKIDSKFWRALASYEVKVDGKSIGDKPIRVLELDGKQIINFFDYTGDTSLHPKMGQRVDIIAHNIFGDSHSVFSGRAELSDDLWKVHYKVSEWHKKDNAFDALYLSPIPTGLTENVKSYDIQINKDKYQYAPFERKDNGGYVRDQRLQLDFSKKEFLKGTLPKLGDFIKLTIHTVEGKHVEIDLGKVEESTKPDSVNNIEKVHAITEWTKKDSHYTQVSFNTGSGEIISYVFKVNNHYYGEIPVSTTTLTLDLSKCNNNKQIQKGDYIEIYAYKKDGEGVLIQSRYAGTTGLLGAYPTEESIKKEFVIMKWAKSNHAYTSFTLDKLSDPVDSYVKKYEGLVNNQIVNLTQADTVFSFDPMHLPFHGEIIQILAYTYTGRIVDLGKSLAGATGLVVTDEEVRSMHTIKNWGNENKIIIFDTNELDKHDSIQSRIKSYTIEVWKGPNTPWESFGNPISLNEKGELHLQDCKANKPFPQPPNVVRVTAHFFDDTIKPIIVMVRKVGVTDPPPTVKQILEAHKNYTWKFEGKKLKSIIFPHVNSEYASYISTYQINKWSNPITEKNVFKVNENKGLTVTLENAIDVTSLQKTAVGNGKTEERKVQAEISAFVHCINIGEKTELKPILVIGTYEGEKNVRGVSPEPPISKEDIVKAHQIENWVYDWNGTHVTLFYFNKQLQQYLTDIQYYSIKINGTEHLPPDYVKNQTLSLEIEEGKDGKANGPQGLPIRFNTFNLTGGVGKELPSPGDTLDVTAHLKDNSSLQVIKNYKIPSKE
ncbi:binary toxin-like calcium binding domain-containing protein [Bacillus thuringiensis]|uniref:binary toxin-like calcium binding domain-containing protein n=1 Tax=Bacillus cereus group TaxID=86661 RepID=UPI000347CFA6|nr:binary toxin-like calcium binding domain-containing protein [Bacillus thuringiensis]MCH5450225.1 hypothetical protein [Bacillus cereus]MCU5187669.1 hypothetical protein [Bacillus cereus]